MNIRVIYDNNEKQIKAIFESGTYNTEHNYDAIQDSPENCKIALGAFGFSESELQKIDDFITV